VRVTDEKNVESVVAECERYWRSTGVPSGRVDEMKAELMSHLREAEAEGKSVTAVVGPDISAFAEEWAAEYRPVATKPTSTPGRSREGLIWLWVSIAVIALIFIAVAILIPKEDTVDAEAWQWIWVIAAVVLAIGELLTAGFFLLPFAVGAGAAAVLAFTGASVVWQLLMFTVVSIVFLALLQRFARKEMDQDPPRVGAERYRGRTAIVDEAVNRRTGSGMVRMDTEHWRATTDGDAEIPEGTEVRVVEVRGTRLVVERIETE
jgi:membrane protein implicated in regulation of membrane protease activity